MTLSSKINRLRIRLAIAIAVLPLLLTGCDNSSFPSGPQSESVTAHNGLYYLSEVPLLLHSARSTLQGYVYVGGERVGSSGGLLGLFSPNGTLFRDWEFSSTVVDVNPTGDGGALVIRNGYYASWLPPDGDSNWNLICGEFGTVREDNSFVTAGYVDGEESIAVKAFDHDGVVLWERLVPVNRSIYAIGSDPLGRVAVAVDIKDGLTTALHLVLVEADGSSSQTVELEDTGFAYVENTLVPTPAGKWILCGTTFVDNHAQVQVAAFDDAGNSTWNYTSSGSSRSLGVDACMDRNGTLFVLAVRSTDDGKTHDALNLLSFDPDGSLLSSRSYGDPETDNVGFDVSVIGDGRIQMIGQNDFDRLFVVRDEAYE